MPALTTREAARQRIMATCQAMWDQFIPANEQVPLRGQYFQDFEEQALEFTRTAGSVLLEERAALAVAAQAKEAGVCPHCGSSRTYLLADSQRQTELRSPFGSVVLPLQDAKCRACGRHFSPSAARPAGGRRGAADAHGSSAGGPGMRGADFRSGGQGD
jgi:hypothetical protein